MCYGCDFDDNCLHTKLSGDKLIVSSIDYARLPVNGG
jgi:hypothetical protein